MEKGPYLNEDLSMQNFRNFFSKRELGTLSLPNGKHDNYSGNYVDLDYLYKNLIGTTEGSSRKNILLPVGDIIAVIAFGPAVKYPGEEEVIRMRRKYIFWGEETKTITMERIEPKDADFFVIVNQDLSFQRRWSPSCCHFGSTIYSVFFGVNQVIQGIQDRNVLCISAFEEGIPIFFDYRFNKIIAETKVEKKTPRKIFWYKEDGELNGEIR